MENNIMTHAELGEAFVSSLSEDSNYLEHYGIKGMKWGVRRDKKRSMSDDAQAVSELRKKKPSQLSNAELKKLNERIQLEQNYSRLNPSKLKKSIAFVGTTAATIGTITSLYNNGGTLLKIGKTACDKLVDVAGNVIMKDLAKHL